MKSVEELIEFNKRDTIELRYYDQELLLEAQKKGSVESKEFLDILAKMNRLVREEGIDKVMAENNLDAFIAPTGSPAWKTDLVNGDCLHCEQLFTGCHRRLPEHNGADGFCRRAAGGHLLLRQGLERTVAD